MKRDGRHEGKQRRGKEDSFQQCAWTGSQDSLLHFPESFELDNVTLVPWDPSWGKYLYHGNHQTLQMSILPHAEIWLLEPYWHIRGQPSQEEMQSQRLTCHYNYLFPVFADYTLLRLESASVAYGTINPVCYHSHILQVLVQPWIPSKQPSALSDKNLCIKGQPNSFFKSSK